AFARASGVHDAPARIDRNGAARAVRVRGAGTGAPRRYVRPVLRDLARPFHGDVAAHLDALRVLRRVGGDHEAPAWRALYAERAHGGVLAVPGGPRAGFLSHDHGAHPREYPLRRGLRDDGDRTRFRVAGAGDVRGDDGRDRHDAGFDGSGIQFLDRGAPRQVHGRLRPLQFFRLVDRSSRRRGAARPRLEARDAPLGAGRWPRDPG